MTAAMTKYCELESLPVDFEDFLAHLDYCMCCQEHVYTEFSEFMKVSKGA
jgi:hypothetical protein